MGMLLSYHPGYRGPAPEAETEDRPVERQNKAQLQETAASLGLATDGTKAQLRERVLAKLAEDDAPEPDTDEPDGEDQPDEPDDSEPDNDQSED